MKRLLLISILLCLFAVYANAYNITAEPGLEKYIQNVESQIGSDINNIISARKNAENLLNNEKSLAQEMAYLLGCKDEENLIFTNIHYYLYDCNVIIKTLSNIKLISYDKIKTSSELKAGYVSYEFVNEKNVNIVFSSMISENNENNFYLPILIDEKGNIVKKEELIDGLIAIGGTNELKGPLLLYTAVNESIKQILKIYYPFSRWYNEGMNYKVTSLLLKHVNYKNAKEFDQLFDTSKESQTLKDKVNLWNFPQTNLVAKDDYSKPIETANVQASCRLLDELYNKVGREGIHKINTELKYSEFLTNEQICKIINAIANVDFKNMLSEYIPESCQKLINDSAKIEELIKNSSNLMNDKKYKEAIPILETVLTANPYHLNARLNLGRCYRETKNIINSDKNILIAANATIPGPANISIYGEENEQIYVIIGKYLFLSNAINDAYNFLSKAYEKDKSPDIKQIIDSIELTRENIKKETYGE